MNGVHALNVPYTSIVPLFKLPGDITIKVISDNSPFPKYEFDKELPITENIAPIPLSPITSSPTPISATILESNEDSTGISIASLQVAESVRLIANTPIVVLPSTEFPPVVEKKECIVTSVTLNKFEKGFTRICTFADEYPRVISTVSIILF